MLTYAIFKKEKTDFTWVGAAEELESAKRCIKERSSHSDGEFALFASTQCRSWPILKPLELPTPKS